MFAKCDADCPARAAVQVWMPVEGKMLTLTFCNHHARQYGPVYQAQVLTIMAAESVAA